MLFSLIFISKGTDFLLPLSMGVAELMQDGSMSSCIKRADEALYEAKDSGRNAVRFAVSQF